MTREEAIEELYRIAENQYRSAEKDKEALGMAIEALEQEPCEDVVSRQAVDQNIYDYAESNGLSYANLKNAILDVPPVTPTRKVGKWIRHYCNNGDLHHITCSNCHTWHENFSEYRYCPNCGAEMESEE